MLHKESAPVAVWDFNNTDVTVGTGGRLYKVGRLTSEAQI